MVRTTGMFYFVLVLGIFFVINQFSLFFCRLQLVGAGVVWITEAWVGFVFALVLGCFFFFFFFCFFFFFVFFFVFFFFFFFFPFFLFFFLFLGFGCLFFVFFPFSFSFSF